MKPRLYDPRTGYRIGPVRHRNLLAYARRVHAAAVARWREAEDRLDVVRTRAAVSKWERRHASAYRAMRRWAAIIKDLEDQLRRKIIEFELKFSYEGSQAKKNKGTRANINLRMRWQGLRMPSDREVRKAFLHVLAHKQAPRRWSYAWHDWANDSLGTSGWRKGRWRSGGTEPSKEGAAQGERTDPGALDWVETIWVGGGLTLDDLDITTIGEVEED